jgi:uncharacterized short protein YbdD (DUF466 family)
MERLLQFWRALEQVMGGMDYVRYCEHVRTRHPKQRLPSAGEYYLARVRERYARPNRCC